jgi:hypothetical protein
MSGIACLPVRWKQKIKINKQIGVGTKQRQTAAAITEADSSSYNRGEAADSGHTPDQTAAAVLFDFSCLVLFRV